MTSASAPMAPAGGAGIDPKLPRSAELPDARGRAAPAARIPTAGTAFGYLVPAFPDQRHAFFWREITALRRLGARPHLISTRKPPRTPRTHAWAHAAAAEAEYLFPGSPRDMLA